MWCWGNVPRNHVLFQCLTQHNASPHQIYTEFWKRKLFYNVCSFQRTMNSSARVRDVIHFHVITRSIKTNLAFLWENILKLLLLTITRDKLVVWNRWIPNLRIRTVTLNKSAVLRSASGQNSSVLPTPSTPVCTEPYLTVGRPGFWWPLKCGRLPVFPRPRL